MLQITAYGVVCTMFSDDLMKYIGYLEIVVGLGLSLGPYLGQFLMKYLAYDHTMYVFASTCVFGFLMANFLIPSELNQTASDEELAELEMLEANAADAD